MYRKKVITMKIGVRGTCSDMIIEAETAEVLYGDKCLDDTLNEVVKLLMKYGWSKFKAIEWIRKNHHYVPNDIEGLWSIYHD